MFNCLRNIGLHSYIILASAAFIRLLVTGLWYTPGILYVAFRDEFKNTSGVTSWITTLQYFVSSVSCVVGGLLVGRWGSRTLTVIGAIFMSSGLITSMLASHISHIFITFAVLSGMGAGLIYIGSLEAMNIHFTKQRNLLFGITAFVGNMGIIIYPVLLQTLMDEFNWRGMFLIIGGIELNALAVAIVYPGRRVPPSTEVCIERESKDDASVVMLHGTPSTGVNGSVRTNVDNNLNEEQKQYFVTKTNGHEPSGNDADVDDDTADDSADDDGGDDVRKEVSVNRSLERYEFLRNRHYYLYLLSGGLYLFGAGIILGHLSAYTVLNGIADKFNAAMLYTIIGVSMSFTKLIQGCAINNDRLNAVKFHIVATGMGGLATFVFLFKVSFPVLCVYVVVFGVSAASIGGALLPAIILKMSGEEHFAFSLGLNICITAFGTLIGAPIAGWIFDATNSYTIPFLLAAVAMVLSALATITSCNPRSGVASERIVSK